MGGTLESDRGSGLHPQRTEDPGHRGRSQLGLRLSEGAFLALGPRLTVPLCVAVAVTSLTRREDKKFNSLCCVDMAGDLRFHDSAIP